MKKIFIVTSLLAMLAACGSGGEKKAETPGTETPTATEKPADDLSNNPDYQKGLAIVSEAKNLCLTCHKIEEKLTGPAYRDVANKYENTEANVKMLAAKVKNGGGGVWGEVLMPANASISPEDAEAAVKYIMLLKNK
jgi:cytochrome c